VTVESSAKFHGAVYLDKPHRVEARIGDTSRRRMEATARIIDRKERVRAEAAGTFAVLGEAQATRVIGDNLGTSAEAYLSRSEGALSLSGNCHRERPERAQCRRRPP
jgi:hypothetical protein